MRSTFPLFQSHLDMAHSYWQQLVQLGDSVIDATCGAGHDTAVLARLALTDVSGALHAFDVQQSAILATKRRLQDTLPSQVLERVHVHQQSHATFPASISPNSVRLIVYNLGYLPGANKDLTTSVSSTLQSLASALPLLQDGGCVSVTAYPGHAEGARERDAILEFTTHLDPTVWSCCQHVWLNRRAAPTLILIQRAGAPVQPTTRL